MKRILYGIRERLDTVTGAAGSFWPTCTPLLTPDDANFWRPPTTSYHPCEAEKAFADRPDRVPRQGGVGLRGALRAVQEWRGGRSPSGRGDQRAGRVLRRASRRQLLLTMSQICHRNAP